MPVSHLGDMRALFDGIPLAEMNTSMTINATAAWLLALYIAVADEQGAPRAKLTGTTQNDIIKEYLSRGTYVFPPAPSMRLIKDVDPVHDQGDAEMEPDECLLLSSAGGGRDAGAGTGLRAGHRDRRARHGEGLRRGAGRHFGEVVGRISFFVNAGMRFVTESARCAPSPSCGTRSPRQRYGVNDPKQRRFRYGVQVNSLGLTEQQPENNVYRILLEMLAVVLSKNARARAVQLPAWNEALGLPRPFDQQWSLRMQQILAYETDLLEYGDIFDGSTEIATQGRGAQARGEGRARHHRAAGRRGRRGRDGLHEAAAGRDQHRAGWRRSRPASRSWSASTSFVESEPSPLDRRHRRDHDRARTRSKPSRSRG